MTFSLSQFGVTAAATVVNKPSNRNGTDGVILLSIDSLVPYNILSAQSQLHISTKFI